MAFLDLKTVKKKKLDAHTTLTISENLTGERLFIEFSTNDQKLRLEKSFSSTGLGKRDAERFLNQIQSTTDLRNYFGLSKES